MKDILAWFIRLWFISLPISVYFVYTIITELLDLLLNSNEIKKNIELCDSIDLKKIEDEYLISKERKNRINQPILSELEFKVKYKREKETLSKQTEKIHYIENLKNSEILRLYNIFKISE